MRSMTDLGPRSGLVVNFVLPSSSSDWEKIPTRMIEGPTSTPAMKESSARKAKMIGRCKAGTYELTTGWEDKLRPTLLAAWEQAREPDKDGGTPPPAPTGANP